MRGDHREGRTSYLYVARHVTDYNPMVTGNHAKVRRACGNRRYVVSYRLLRRSRI